MNSLNTFDSIREWAGQRNLIDGSNPQAQTVKLMEEVGELAAGVARQNKDQIVDSIGDAVVVLTILAAQLDITIEACIDFAWAEIKDRKGKMVNGVFIKEGEQK